MLIYCDTSVLAHLLVDDARQVQVRHELMSWARQGSLFTSQLTRVELARVIMRYSRSRHVELSTPISYVGIDERILAIASHLEVQYLKTLDALHLATALLAGAQQILTYDQQMARACEEVGLSVA